MTGGLVTFTSRTAAASWSARPCPAHVSFKPGTQCSRNLYNVIHGATHVLARGNTTCTDDRLGCDTQRTHGLFSEFSWSGRNR